MKWQCFLLSSTKRCVKSTHSIKFGGKMAAALTGWGSNWLKQERFRSFETFSSKPRPPLSINWRFQGNWHPKNTSCSFLTNYPFQKVVLIIKLRKFGIKQVDEGKITTAKWKRSWCFAFNTGLFGIHLFWYITEYERAPLLFLSKRYFTAGRNRDFLRIFFQKFYHDSKESIVLTVFLALAQQVTVSSK